MSSYITFLWVIYSLFLLGLFGYLLIRGVTHFFVPFFFAGALLELLQQVGFLVLQNMAGGYSANRGCFSLLSHFGVPGPIGLATGFLLLAQFLLPPKPAA